MLGLMNCLFALLSFLCSKLDFESDRGFEELFGLSLLFVLPIAYSKLGHLHLKEP
jgi:hypothetical protein